MGGDTALCNTIWALRDATQQTFFNILKSRGEKLLRYPPLVAVDLSPPPAVREGISLLLELINTYNSMMVPASGKRPNFDPVISAILDPIIQVSFLCLMCFVVYRYLKGIVGKLKTLSFDATKILPIIQFHIVILASIDIANSPVFSYTKYFLCTFIHVTTE